MKQKGDCCSPTQIARKHLLDAFAKPSGFYYAGPRVVAPCTRADPQLGCRCSMPSVPAFDAVKYPLWGLLERCVPASAPISIDSGSNSSTKQAGYRDWKPSASQISSMPAIYEGMSRSDGNQPSGVPPRLSGNS